MVSKKTEIVLPMARRKISLIELGIAEPTIVPWSKVQQKYDNDQTHKKITKKARKVTNSPGKLISKKKKFLLALKKGYF